MKRKRGREKERVLLGRMQGNEEAACYYRGAIRARWVIFPKPVLRAADAYGMEDRFPTIHSLGLLRAAFERSSSEKRKEYKARVAPVFLYRKYIPIVCARDFVFADDVYESPSLRLPRGHFYGGKCLAIR